MPEGKLTRPAQLNGARLRKQMGDWSVTRIVAPPAVVNQVIPLRYQVVDRTAVVGLAERHAAVHTARALRLQVCLVVRRIDFLEIDEAHRWIAIRLGLALVILKSGGFSHNQ